MQLEVMVIPALLWLAMTSLVLLISADWRLSISALALQYVAQFVLVAQAWGVEMAVVKLVAGWMAGAVLGMAVVGLITPRPVPSDDEGPAPRLVMPQPEVHLPSAYLFSGRAFRLLAAVLVGLSVLSINEESITWLAGVTLEQVWGGLLLAGMGMLQLSFSSRPFRLALGLLTALSGFEIIYASIETSTLMAGLLAALTLGIALAGAYLLLVHEMEPE